jgi:hypothetical protein
VDVPLGCTNRTEAAEPMSKLRQLMTAELLVCWTVMLAAVWWMAAKPAATDAPLGKVLGATSPASPHEGIKIDNATNIPKANGAGRGSGGAGGNKPNHSFACDGERRRITRLTDEPKVPQLRAHSLTATQQAWALFQTRR